MATTSLSAFTQCCGYLIASVGPFGFGVLYDLTRRLDGAAAGPVRRRGDPGVRRLLCRPAEIRRGRTAGRRRLNVRPRRSSSCPTAPSSSGGGQRGPPLTAAGETEPVRGGARPPTPGRPSTSESTRSASARRGASRGRLAMTCTEALTTVNPRGAHPGQHLGQQRRAGRGGPAGVVDAEDRPEIAETGGGQHRITQCVRGDVAVGMAGATVGLREQQPGQPACPAGLDRMHVDPGAHPQRRHAIEAVGAISRSASSRSSGVVILKAARSPGTGRICTPMVSTRPASSVAARPPVAAARCARRSTAGAKPCGVCTTRSWSRSTMPSRLPSDCHRAHGVDDRQHRDDRGRTGPNRFDHGPDQRFRGECPRGVVHQHDVGIVADDRERGGHRCRPVGAADDESDAIAPPRRAAQQVVPDPQRAAAARDRSRARRAGRELRHRARRNPVAGRRKRLRQDHGRTLHPARAATDLGRDPLFAPGRHDGRSRAAVAQGAAAVPAPYPDDLPGSLLARSIRA